jgi:hypothetical protein
MSVSIITGLLFFASLALLYELTGILFHLGTWGADFVPLTSRAWVAAIAILWVLFALACVGLSVIYFRKEMPYWSAKGMTADRLLAGIIVFGIAMVWAMAELFVHSHSHNVLTLSICLFGVLTGFASCLGAFGIGLCYAFAEWFSERSRTLASVRVERRYGLDVNLVPHEDYGTPHMDGMEAIVICKMRDGTRLHLNASANAYYLAEPGKTGTAVVRGTHLDRFSVR